MLVYTASPKCYCNICHRVEAFGTDQDSPSWWVLSKTSPAFHLLSFSPPEVGLFGADVGTDLVNGHNLIETGDPIWGTLMISLPFLPALILGILLVLMAIGQKNWCTLCLVLLFFVPLVALATPLCQGRRRFETSVFFSVKINILTTGGFRVGFFQPDTNHP